MALQLSCTAPAKISLALADCWLMSTVSGACVRAGPRASKGLFLTWPRPSVTTTVAPSAATQVISY